MLFGSPGLNAIDDASAALSKARARVRLIAARLRMVLTDDDCDELEALLEDLDRAQAYGLIARAELNDAYWQRIGRKERA